MRKNQELKFKSLDDFFAYLPEPERELCYNLHRAILSCNPHITCKLSYGVPTYFCPKRIGGLWPSAIPWSGVKMGVAFVISHGRILLGDYRELSPVGKTLARLDFTIDAPVNYTLLKNIVNLLIEIDK